MTVPVSFLAGIAAFFSPCVLPLLPIWLAFMGGSKTESRLKLAVNLVFFTAGFTVIFTLLGASASALGQVLANYQAILTRIAGIVLIIFGLQIMGVFQLSFLSRKLGFKQSAPQSPWGFFVMGVVLALGWTPCVGLILGPILMLASSLDTVYQGMILLFVFSLGFSLPFFISGLLIGTAPLQKISPRTLRYVQIGAGLILVVMGVLLLSDHWVLVQNLFL